MVEEGEIVGAPRIAATIGCDEATIRHYRRSCREACAIETEPQTIVGMPASW
jgi:hypothetical protein